MPQQVTLSVQVVHESSGEQLLIEVLPDGRPAGPTDTPDDETPPGSGG